jgi:hypothetical protein
MTIFFFIGKSPFLPFDLIAVVGGPVLLLDFPPGVPCPVAPEPFSPEGWLMVTRGQPFFVALHRSGLSVTPFFPAGCCRKL